MGELLKFVHKANGVCWVNLSWLREGQLFPNGKQKQINKLKLKKKCIFDDDDECGVAVGDRM